MKTSQPTFAPSGAPLGETARNPVEASGAPEGVSFRMLQNPKDVRASIHHAIYLAKKGNVEDHGVQLGAKQGLIAVKTIDNLIRQKIEEISTLHAQRQRINELLQSLGDELFAAHGRIYTTARKAANAEISKKEVRMMIFGRDGWTCKHCGKRSNLTIDHIVPVLKGGTNEPSNLQTLCKRCNSKKGAKLIDQPNKETEANP